MARSIKSKRGMALRRIKRIRYGKKELIRLNKMLGLPNKEDNPDDVEMKNEEEDKKKGLSSKDYNLLKRIVKETSDTDDSDVDKAFDEVMVLTSSKFLRRKCQAKQHDENKRQLAISQEKAAAAAAAAAATEVEAETPEEKIEKAERKHNSTTLVDDYGTYPKWMNQKKIQAMAKVNRHMKLKRQKRLELVKRRRPIKFKRNVNSDDEGEEEDKEEEGDTPEGDSTEGLEMETDEVTTTAKVAPPKGAAKRAEGKVKKAKKSKKIQQKKNAIPDDSGVSSNAEDPIETIDLSD